MMKKCSKCETIKELALFYKNRRNKDGLYDWCKSCWSSFSYCEDRKKKRNINGMEKGYSQKRKDYSKNWMLKKNYGITIEELEVIRISQDNKCAICRKEEASLKYGLCVDHNHITGKVRGLLCRNCNCAIGMFDENINFMTSSIEYLKKHNE